MNFSAKSPEDLQVQHHLGRSWKGIGGEEDIRVTVVGSRRGDRVWCAA